MGRGLLSTAVVAVLGGFLAVSGAASPVSFGAPAEAAFRLADGSAGCAFDGSRLACRGARARSAVVLDVSGSAHADDVEVDWNAGTTVLRSSERWLHGSFSCRVAVRQVVCTTLSGGLLVAGTSS
jgi:hypothetical protein